MKEGEMEEGKMYFGNWGDGENFTKKVDLNIYGVKLIMRKPKVNQ